MLDVTIATNADPAFHIQDQSWRMPQSDQPQAIVQEISHNTADKYEVYYVRAGFLARSTNISTGICRNGKGRRVAPPAFLFIQN
jgi:hypothetical protein